MTSAQEMSVTVTDNNPLKHYPHPDNHTTRSVDSRLQINLTFIFRYNRKFFAACINSGTEYQTILFYSGVPYHTHFVLPRENLSYFVRPRASTRTCGRMGQTKWQRQRRFKSCWSFSRQLFYHMPQQRNIEYILWLTLVTP